MPQGVLGKRSRTVSKPVADQIVVDDLLKNPYAVFPNFLKVVVARFERPPVLPFGLPRDGFGSSLGGFVDLLSPEAKPVPKIFPL